MLIEEHLKIKPAEMMKIHDFSPGEGGRKLSEPFGCLSKMSALGPPSARGGGDQSQQPCAQSSSRRFFDTLENNFLIAWQIGSPWLPEQVSTDLMA